MTTQQEINKMANQLQTYLDEHTLVESTATIVTTGYYNEIHVFAKDGDSVHHIPEIMLFANYHELFVLADVRENKPVIRLFK